MTQPKWFRLALVVVLLAMVSSFAIGGNGCDFLSKKDDNNTGSSVTPTPTPTPTPSSEQYYLGLKPLPRAQYDLIPMISAPAGGLTGLPSSYDLSSNMPTPGDQGQQGSCVGWATAYALKTQQEQKERSWGANTNAHRFSPAYIYNQIHLGGDGGAYISDAINILTAQGCATLATMPYNQNDYSTPPSQAARNEAANYKCIIYRTVNIMDRTEIKGFLYSGAPLVIGITVGSDLWRQVDANYVYRTLGDRIIGNHAVTLVGYSDTKSAFKFINSWGSGWGDGGYSWIDYNFFSQVCYEAYWVQDYVETQRMGSLAVNSTPSSAGVYLNDVYKGTTPITLISIPVGNYSLKISKTGYVTQDIAVTILENQVPDINVTLVAQALPAPILMAPAYGSATTDTTPDFDWTDIPGASTYGIMVDNNSDFSSPEINQTATASNYTPATPLTAGAYYWKVKTQDGSSQWGAWSSPGLFTINQTVTAPAQVTSPNPANGIANVITTTSLAWALADRATSYDVYFGTTSPGTSRGIQNSTSYNPGVLNPGTTYYWRIDSRNSAGSTTGIVWSFTTVEGTITPPAQVTSPNPADSEPNVITTTQLAWASADRTTSYDVYFGASNPPPKVVTDTANTSYNPGTLALGTIYYWQIDSKNSAGTTTGDVWSFTTITLPVQVTSPNPLDGTTNLPITQQLSWAATDGATSYDVYFGTTSPGTFRENQAGTTYDPGTLSTGTYYWRIDSKNAAGTTQGTVWSFTANEPPPPPPPPDQVGASGRSPTNGATDISVNPTLSWATAANATSYDVYFGTTNPPPYKTNRTSTTYNRSGLNYRTTYYWRINSKNETGTTEGYVWSFTTGGGSQTFNYTGGQQTWVVPAGITSIQVDARGAQGGNSSGIYTSIICLGGKGGRVQSTLSVTPGETIYIVVAGAGSSSGSGGYGGAAGGNGGGNGAGGGGGCSWVWASTSGNTIYANGGGGAGGNNNTGSNLGGNGGSTGSGSNGSGGGGGSGGGQGSTSGGTGGTGGGGGIGGSKGGDGNSGYQGGGGNGGAGTNSLCGGGGGGGGGYYNGGGGGGGGYTLTSYYGGGGGGGRGSSSTTGTLTYTSDSQSGNGYVKITY